MRGGAQQYTWEQIQTFSQPLTLAEGRGNLQPRYNIAPTTQIDIIVAAGETRRLAVGSGGQGHPDPTGA